MALLKRRQRSDEPQQGQITRGAKDGNPLTRLRSEMDRMFERVWKEFGREPWSALSQLPQSLGEMTSWPAMDVDETDKEMTVRLDVPGLDAKDLDIQVSGNQLTIRGQRTEEKTEEHQGLHRRERYSGSFARSVTLPSYVDPAKVEARYEKGTLVLTAPKIPGQGPKRVEISP